MGKTELIERLNALATSSRNRSNTARLRDIFLHVEHAIKAGVPLQIILEELKTEGFTFTYNSFINALVKIRKEYRDNTNQQQTETKKSTTSLLPKTNTKRPNDLCKKEEEITAKQRREKIANLFISEPKISPRLQRILEKKDESSSD